MKAVGRGYSIPVVDLANERGGDDNITVITLKVKSVQDGRGGFLGFLSKLLFPFKK